MLFLAANTNRAPLIFQQRARRPRVLDELGHWELKCSVSKVGARLRAEGIRYRICEKSKEAWLTYYRFSLLKYLLREKYCNYPLTSQQGDRFASCENILSRFQTSSLLAHPPSAHTSVWVFHDGFGLYQHNENTETFFFHAFNMLLK